MLSSEGRGNIRLVRAPRLAGWAPILLLILLATLASGTPIVDQQFTCSPLCSITNGSGYGYFNNGLQAGAFVEPNVYGGNTRFGSYAYDTITLWADYTTDGPVRPGVLEYTLFISGPGSATLDGMPLGPSYNWCQDCTVPITLGVPFEIVLKASASGSCEAGVGCYFFNGHQLTNLRFQIIDPQTAAPVALHDVTIPEPRGLGAGGLLVLIGAAWFRRKRLGLRRL